MSRNSTGSRRSKKAAPDRPKKPFKEFPLYPHPLGYWSKKINGKIRHFGRWGRVVKGKLTRIEGDGWEEALKLYKAQVDDLYAERVSDRPVVRPAETTTEGTVKDLCDQFYTAKRRAFDAGEITQRTLDEYDATCVRIVKAFGRQRVVDSLTADDFEKLRADLAKQFGPVRLGNEITRIKSVFRYGRKSDLIPAEFKKPSKSVLRRHRATGGGKMFTAEEVRRMLDAASRPLKAMILLGINAGFGNSDCGTLPIKAVDLEGGWISYARPKTGIPRRCPLWPETLEALRAYLDNRPEPKDKANSGLVFITKHGGPWSKGGSSDAVTLETGKLLRSLQINGRRGLGFYSLRHTFRTVADATLDRTAIRLIMGHTDESIDAHYIETEHIADSRLRAVVEHVRAWLFSPSPEGKGGGQ